MGERIKAAKQRFLDLKITQHVSNNRSLYLTGVSCLVVGFLGARHPDSVRGTIKGSNNTQLLARTQNVTMIEVTVEALGDPGNIIQDTTNGLGTIYASQGQAARELGVAPSRISEHLAGKLPHVKGHTFEKLGKASIPAVA